jgi:hypothetical protein
MAEKPKIICWDLDETLGSFRELVSVRSGIRSPHPHDVYVLRKDIIRTLNRMIGKGYKHVVVSSAKLEYSQQVLQTVCLDAYFDKVLGRSKPAEGIWGKKYRPAAEAFALDESTALSNLLVIANQASDEPVDLGVVFMHDQRGLDTSALEYDEIADALLRNGEGSFKRGFDFFFETGRRMTCLDQDLNFMLVSARLTNRTSADLGYRNSPCTPGLKVPIIFNLRPA